MPAQNLPGSVAISPLFRSHGNMRVRLPHEGFYFSLKIIYQRKLVLILFVERKLGFPFGFGETRNENTKGKIGIGEGSCEGWVCFGKAASLIIREGKESLQVNNSHAIDFSSSSAPHQSLL